MIVNRLTQEDQLNLAEFLQKRCKTTDRRQGRGFAVELRCDDGSIVDTMPAMAAYVNSQKFLDKSVTKHNIQGVLQVLGLLRSSSGSATPDPPAPKPTPKTPADETTKTLSTYRKAVRLLKRKYAKDFDYFMAHGEEIDEESITECQIPDAEFVEMALKNKEALKLIVDHPEDFDTFRKLLSYTPPLQAPPTAEEVQIIHALERSGVAANIKTIADVLLALLSTPASEETSAAMPNVIDLSKALSMRFKALSQKNKIPKINAENIARILAQNLLKGVPLTTDMVQDNKLLATHKIFLVNNANDIMDAIKLVRKS